MAGAVDLVVVVLSCCDFRLNNDQLCPVPRSPFACLQHVQHALDRGAIETLMLSDILLRSPDLALRRQYVL